MFVSRSTTFLTEGAVQALNVPHTLRTPCTFSLPFSFWSCLLMGCSPGFACCPFFLVDFFFPATTFHFAPSLQLTSFAAATGAGVCLSNVSTVPFNTLASSQSESTHNFRRTIAPCWRSDLHEGQKNGSGDAEIVSKRCFVTPAHQRWCQHSQVPSQYSASWPSSSPPALMGSRQMGQVWVAAGFELASFLLAFLAFAPQLQSLTC